MALSAAVLGPLIKTEIEAVQTVADATQLAKIADAIAEAVVAHITTAGVVVMDGGGADTNGDSLVVNTGKVT